MSFRAVVIGLGRIGFSMEGEYGRARPCTHAGVLDHSDEIELIGGFDPCEEAVTQFEEKFPGTENSSSSLSEFLDLTKPQIVSVACSSDSHLETLQILHEWDQKNRTIQGILLEKPVGMNYSEGCEIARIEEDWNIPVVVCHDRRYYSRFQQIKKLVSKRGLGKLCHLRGVVNAASYVPGRRSKNHSHFGGPLLHDGTHLLDLMIYYAGLPSHCSALSFTHPGSKTEDTTMAHLLFDSEVTGNLYVGGRRKYFHFEIELEWERAKLWVSHDRLLFRKKSKNTPYLDQEIKFQEGSENPYLMRLQNLIEVIRSKAQNQSGVREGVQVLQVIETLYESSRRKGQLLAVGESSGDYPGFLAQNRA